MSFKTKVNHAFLTLFISVKVIVSVMEWHFSYKYCFRVDVENRPLKQFLQTTFLDTKGDISSISPISLGFGVAYLNIAYSGVQGVQSQVLRGTKVFTRNVSTWYGPLYWYSDELNISPLNLQASFFQSLQRILLRSLRRFSKPITR